MDPQRSWRCCLYPRRIGWVQSKGRPISLCQNAKAAGALFVAKPISSRGLASLMKRYPSLIVDERVAVPPTMANFVRSSPGVSARFGTERRRLHNYSRAGASAGVALRGAWREQEHPASEADVPAAIFGC